MGRRGCATSSWQRANNRPPARAGERQRGRLRAASVWGGEAGSRRGACQPLPSEMEQLPAPHMMRKHAWVRVLFHVMAVQKVAVSKSAFCCILHFRPLSCFIIAIIIWFYFFFVSGENVIKITAAELFTLAAATWILPSPPLALEELVHTCGITLTSRQKSVEASKIASLASCLWVSSSFCCVSQQSGGRAT